MTILAIILAAILCVSLFFNWKLYCQRNQLVRYINATRKSFLTEIVPNLACYVVGIIVGRASK